MNITLIISSIILVTLLLTIIIILVNLFNTNKKLSNNLAQKEQIITNLEMNTNQLISQIQEKENYIQIVNAREKEMIREQQRINQEVANQQQELVKKTEEVNEYAQKLQKQEYSLREREEIFAKKVKDDLLVVASLNQEEAEQRVMDAIRSEKRTEISQELAKFENKLKLEKKEIAQNILLNAAENISGSEVSEKFSKVIALPDDNLKGRLIGRDGRNINLLENRLGINLIIDETPEQFIISCFNPVRRAIASRVFEILLSSGVINQSSIEETIERVESEFDEQILTKGKEAVSMFEIEDMDISLVKKIGGLYYRTSYGQNVYNHTIEVAKIAVSIANQLQLDAQLAARCALLHDIGKLDSEETGLSHVELGVGFARQAGENDIVVNAIASHHGDEECDNLYSVILIIADSLSASQLGARRDTLEAFIQRVEALEEIALSVEGVDKAYALKGGKEIRIIVNPHDVKDNQLKALAHEIKHKVETSLSIPTPITVNVLREQRYVANVKKTGIE